MKLNQNTLIKMIMLFSIVLINNFQGFSATVTSAATGNWSNASTWNITLTRPGTVTASTSSRTVTGSTLASFTTTLSVGSQILNTSNVVVGTVASIESNTSLTLTANASVAMTNAGWNSRGVGSGDDVSISSGHTITLDGNYSCLSISIPTVNAQTGITFSGTNTLSVSGNISMARPAATTYNCLISIGAGTLNTSTLTMNATTTGRNNNITISTGNLNVTGNITSGTTGCTISITGTGILQMTGTSIGSFTLSPNTTSTVIYNGGAQTIRPATYNNLTIGGTGIKTNTSVTVNGILSFIGSATLSTAITYGSSASLKYNTSSARTVSSNEWPATFVATGGVQILNTGAITLNENKVFSTNVNLDIATNAILITSNFNLTFNANFTNSGTITAGSSNITLSGTATQSIGKFSTTGTFACSKSGGTATLLFDVSANTLNVNTSGGTLFLGTGSFTHSFGNVNLTAGTLNGGNSLLNISGNATKTSGTFTPNTCVVNYNGAVDQSSSIDNYFGLILSGQGIKTLSSSTTVSDNMSTRGSAVYNTTASLIVTGDFFIEETSTVNIGATIFIVNNLTIGNGSVCSLIISNSTGNKKANGDFTLNTNAVFLNSGNSSFSTGGDFNIYGTYTLGDGVYAFNGVDKTINSINLLSFSSIQINGSMSNNAKIEIRSNINGAGSLTNKFDLYINTVFAITNTNIDATSNINTVYYNGIAQNIMGINYYNLQLIGSDIKLFNTNTTSIVNLIVGETAVAKFTRDISISENFIVKENGSVQLSTFTLQIQGNITIQNSGTIDFGTSTVNLNGDTQSIINPSSPLSFYNVITGAGNKNFVYNSSINNSLILDENTYIGMGNTTTLTLNCMISGKGKFTGATCNFTNQHSISFEKSNTNMGSIYIDPASNLFYNFTVKNNANISIINDIQIFNNINLVSGNITFINDLYLHSSNVPITKTSGFITMASGSSILFTGCETSGNNFVFPNNTFSTTPTLTNFTINRTNGVNLGTNTIKVSGTLNIINGNLQTNGFLVLTSNASGTARVSVIPSSVASIAGNVTVERFIPGGVNKRKWRLLSFPVNISGSVSFNQLIDNVLITAPAGSAGGFDVNPLNPANTASLRTYNESTTGSSSNGWTDPVTINASISTGIGFELFVRGSRNLANPYLSWTTPDDVTLDYTGTLNTNDVILNLSYTNTGNPTADGFNLVGNPYASPINFDTAGFSSTNIQNKFWSYNPNTGVYGVYDADLDLGTNGITKYIAPSQGFFVKATSSSASIKFIENIKCINPGNNYFKTNSNTNAYSMLKLSISNDSSFTDETLVLFDDSATSASSDQHDASKFFSDALNIYTLSSDNNNLTIDSRNIASKVDSIRLAVFSYNGSEVMTTSHTIIASNMENIPSSIDVVLWDKFLNTYTDLKSNNRYEFMITSDKESWGKNRFIILVGDVNTGISNNYENSTLRVYPNPSSGDLFLTTSQEWIGKEIQYSIIDQAGRIIRTAESSINNLSTPIDISGIADGFYVLEIISKHKTNRLKFIKRQ